MPKRHILRWQILLPYTVVKYHKIDIGAIHKFYSDFASLQTLICVYMYFVLCNFITRVHSCDPNHSHTQNNYIIRILCTTFLKP